MRNKLYKMFKNIEPEPKYYELQGLNIVLAILNAHVCIQTHMHVHTHLLLMS